jgi:hypothetical protein
MEDFPFFGMAIGGPLDAQHITHSGPWYKAHVPVPMVRLKAVAAFPVDDLEIFEYNYSELYLGSKDVRHGYWLPKGADLKWVREELDRAYQFRATSRGRGALYAALRKEVMDEAATLIEKYNIAHRGDEPQLVLRKDGDLFGLTYAAAIRALGEK